MTMTLKRRRPMKSGTGLPPSALRRLSRRGPAVFGAAVIAMMTVFALLPVSWLPFDPTKGDSRARFLPPFFLPGGGGEHILGTDVLGRDVFSMLIAGSRYTMMIAVSAALIGLILGLAAGLLAAYRQGWVGAVIMRLADVQLAFPVMVLLIAVVAAFGANLLSLILILGVTAWASYARVVYTSTLALKEKDFVEAARAGGLSDLLIVFRHIAPNLVSTLTVVVTFELAQLVLVEAALSFLGLGVQPPDPSWGSMIASAREYLHEHWWASALPGLFIVLTVLSFSLLGDEVRDVLDPEAS